MYRSEEFDTNMLTKEILLTPGAIEELFKQNQDNDTEQLSEALMQRASELRIKTQVKKEIERIVNQKTFQMIDDHVVLECGANGMPINNASNFEKVLTNDSEFNDLFYYDEFFNAIMKNSKDDSVEWSDADDSKLRSDINKKYGLYHPNMLYDAISTVARQKSRNPVKEIIEESKWDKKPRIDRFLIDIYGCDDDIYSREVSRMIFYGGINRLYNPGCQFDYVPILIGPQGAGKSTLVQTLAIKPAYFNEVNTIDGKEGIEAVIGSWICEMSELTAMYRQSDNNALKAFVTRREDKYRPAYGRRVERFKRKCIIIGTSNDSEFLTDQTGNRRYLPIEVHVNGHEIYKNISKIRNYVLKCWQEALYLMNSGKTYLSIPVEYLDMVEEQQKNAAIDDPSTGAILAYLEQFEIGDKISAIEIFTKALNGIKKNFTKLEGRNISRLMNTLVDWDKISSFRTKDHGVQRGWMKVDPNAKRKPHTIKIDNDFSDLD